LTDTIFKGNPAGVCILEEPLSDEKMLLIAQELGLSETAFVETIEGENKFSIRYFSPVMEIPLCGHATLAASKVLFESIPSMSTIHFVTVQEIDLLINKVEDLIRMEFPVYDTAAAVEPQKLLDALGLTKVMDSVYNAETNILMLVIESSETLKALKPDFSALKDSHDTINGVLVTALSVQTQYDFESRYFWPWSGTNEDPVTGGTHTFLAKYWADKLNKKKLKSFQCSARTGFMDLELLENNKLAILSQAQIVLKGELYL